MLVGGLGVGQPAGSGRWPSRNRFAILEFNCAFNVSMSVFRISRLVLKVLKFAGRPAGSGRWPREARHSLGRGREGGHVFYT